MNYRWNDTENHTSGTLPLLCVLIEFNLLFGHPRDRRLKNTLHQEFYCLHIPAMYKRPFQTARCVLRKSLDTVSRRICDSGAMIQVRIRIGGYFWPVENMRLGSQHILVFNDLETKLKNAIPISKMNGMHAAIDLFDHLGNPFCDTSTVLGWHWIPIWFKGVEDFCGYFDLMHVITIAFQPQASGKDERTNPAIVPTLSHFVAGYQKNWVYYTKPMMFVYNAKDDVWQTLSDLSLFFEPADEFQHDRCPNSIMTGIVKPPDTVSSRIRIFRWLSELWTWQTGQCKPLKLAARSTWTNLLVPSQGLAGSFRTFQLIAWAAHNSHSFANHCKQTTVGNCWILWDRLKHAKLCHYRRD